MVDLTNYLDQLDHVIVKSQNSTATISLTANE